MLIAQAESTVNQTYQIEKHLLVNLSDMAVAQDVLAGRFVTLSDILKSGLPEVQGKYLIRLDVKVTVISKEVEELPFNDHYRHHEEEF